MQHRTNACAFDVDQACKDGGGGPRPTPPLQMGQRTISGTRPGITSICFDKSSLCTLQRNYCCTIAQESQINCKPALRCSIFWNCGQTLGAASQPFVDSARVPLGISATSASCERTFRRLKLLVTSANRSSRKRLRNSCSPRRVNFFIRLHFVNSDIDWDGGKTY